MTSLLAERDTAFSLPAEPPTYPALIGLSGFARSGKDSVANALGAYGYGRLSFADPIREALLVANPPVFTVQGHTYFLDTYIDEYGWEKAKDANPLVRPLMERFGDAVKYVAGENVFVKYALDRMDPGKRYVLADVRYDFEAEAIREAGGVIIRVDRPGFGSRTGHSSDRVISEHLVDFVLRNDGALQELPDEIAFVMARVTDWMDR